MKEPKRKLIEVARQWVPIETFEGPLKTIITNLQALNEQYSLEDTREVHIETSPEDGYTEVTAIMMRMETDAELKKRLDKEERKKRAFSDARERAKKKAHEEELKLYQKLKKKYAVLDLAPIFD